MSDKPKSKGRETFWAAREIGVRELDVTFPVASTNKELSRLKSCIAIANKQYQERSLNETALGFVRYEFVRGLTPNRYTEIWRRAMAREKSFDDIIDEMIEKEGK